MQNSSKESSSQAADKLQMISIPIEENIISLRGLSPKRLRFELEYALERGSTDNSFLFTNKEDSERGSKAAVLVHPPGGTYSKVFIPSLAIALPDKDINLQVVVGHVNPNRVALLKELAEIYPKLELISSNPGKKLLQELWNERKPNNGENDSKNHQPIPPLPLISTVRQEQTLFINAGSQLKLIPAPTPRWPGGLLAFEENIGLLMSDKLFAALKLLHSIHSYQRFRLIYCGLLLLVEFLEQKQ